jgi:hypothetical protein
LWLELRLTKKQLKILQDAIRFTAIQMGENGESEEKFLYDLYDEIEKETGVTD